jgi:hypothetical protein
MILSTHAIVGGAIASLIPSHPVLVATLGFASHFAIDAIPHWDYPLRSITVKSGATGKPLRVDTGLFLDLALVGLDGSMGLGLALWLFAAPGTVAAIAIGAFAGMLPDALQVLHILCPREPLRTLQRFHQWIHSKRKLGWQIGAGTQFLFAAAVAEVVLLLS